MKNKTFVLLALLLIFACNTYQNIPTASTDTDWIYEKIPATPQASNGDVQRGFEYISSGNYVGTGAPYGIVEKRFANYRDTLLHRTGDNARTPYSQTVFEMENGVKVITGTCFACHAGRLNGDLIPGLGNSKSDFTKSMSVLAFGINAMTKLKYRKRSEERQVFQPYGQLLPKGMRYIKTPNPGVNPAFRLEEGYACFRDPNNLEYVGKKQYDMPGYVLASDVPPLWTVKKKNALYYNGMGRGDFRKQFMQASLAGVRDTVQARQILNSFKDVLTWMHSLEAPKFPKSIDTDLAERGQAVFEENCSRCHGYYGENERYPNKLISLEKVGTDPYYAQYFMRNKGISSWYNSSWYANSVPYSKHEPKAGYVAPPLDGIWATAPYLHNASVPTLEDLLNSKLRPKYWKRVWDSRAYDYEKMGWQYESLDKPKGKRVYDTTLQGYGNQGHTFGDKLTGDERTALIEYLKTL